MKDKLYYYLLKYLLITAPVYFTYTLINTKNPFLSIMNMLGAGIVTIDLKYTIPILREVIYESGFSIKLFYTPLILLYLSVVVVPFVSISKFVNIGTLPSIWLLLMSRYVSFKAFIKYLTENIYLKYFITYSILSSLVTNFILPMSAINSLKDYISTTDYNTYSLYLQGGLSMLNNKVFVSNFEPMCIAIVVHLIVVSVCSLRMYLKCKSTKVVIKANILLHTLIVSLTLCAYITNTFIFKLC